MFLRKLNTCTFQSISTKQLPIASREMQSKLHPAIYLNCNFKISSLHILSFPISIIQYHVLWVTMQICSELWTTTSPKLHIKTLRLSRLIFYMTLDFYTKGQDSYLELQLLYHTILIATVKTFTVHPCSGEYILQLFL